MPQTTQLTPPPCRQCGGSVHLVGHDMACGICGIPVATVDANIEADAAKQRKHVKLPSDVAYAALMGVPDAELAANAGEAGHTQSATIEAKPRRGKKS